MLRFAVFALLFPLASARPQTAPAAAGKFTAIPLSVPTSASLASRKGSYTVTVPGSGAWTDAGFAVAPGDHLSVSATGTLTLSDGRTTGPEGVAKGWKDLLRTFPAANANAGALVARIGSDQAAVPFAVGGEQNQDIAAGGELFLAVNTGTALNASGDYKATVKLTKAAEAKTPSAPVDLQTILPANLLDSVPRRVADQQGNPGDVVNYAIVGSEADVKKAFTAAGWVAVDRSDNDAVLHGLLATLSKQAYTELPMSTLYLYKRPQDLSYARADPVTVALTRHHLRVWNSGMTVDGQPLWVGSATHDNGIERDQRNNGVTHHIDPNIDTERDFIEQSFAAAGAVSAAGYVTPPDPVSDAKTATGGSFQTDGRVLVMLLRKT